MSLTPPDEFGGPGSPGPDDQDSSEGPSLLSRALGRMRGACRRVGRVVRAGVVAVLDAPSGPVADPSAGPDRSDRDPGDPATPAQYDIVSADAESDDSEDDRQSPPPVVSTRDSAEKAIVADDLGGPETDRPELEVQWHGDAVTLVSPAEPDARITSDVWEDVEP